MDRLVILFLSNAGLAAFLVVSLVVGVRLLWLGRRTQQPPELLIGGAFVVGGVLGYVPEALAVDSATLPAWLRPAMIVLANAAIRIAAVLTLVFSVRVFRPGEAGARSFQWLLALLLAAGFVAYPGPWLLAETSWQHGWSALTAVVRSLAFAWASAESLRHWGLARRRLALGLCEPDVVRRFGLWGVAIAGPAAMSAVPIAQRLLPDPGPAAAWALAQSLLGLVAASAMWLTFFGSRSRRLERVPG